MLKSYNKFGFLVIGQHSLKATTQEKLTKMFLTVVTLTVFSTPIFIILILIIDPCFPPFLWC
jgi:hypothetical protein